MDPLKQAFLPIYAVSAVIGIVVIILVLVAFVFIVIGLSVFIAWLIRKIIARKKKK